MKIQNAVVIVTGASAGIGLAFAKNVAQKGAKVVLAARSAAELTKLEAEIPHSFAVPTDMTKPADIAHLIDETIKKFGRVDVLVNNAGQGLRATVEKIDLADYEAVMQLNVFAVLRAMQAVIPLMRAQGGGMILNVSSMVSKNYFTELGGYASAKYALNALSLTAREELKGDNIIVSVFHPKMTATGFGQNARGEKYVSGAGRPGIGRTGMHVDTAEAVAEAMAQQIESGEAEVMM